MAELVMLIMTHNGDALKEEVILQLVIEIRKKQPHLGIRKLQFLLNPKLKEHKLRVGRDELFNLLDEHKFLVRRR